MSRATGRHPVRKRTPYTVPHMPKTARDEQVLKELREAVGRRIDHLRQDRGMTAKALYGEMEWHKSEYSRKHRGLTPISDEEIVALRRILGAPSVGWPWVSQEEALLLEALGQRAAEVLKHLPKILDLLDAQRKR